MIEPGRRIRRAAVLGAGVMGAQLAAHFANAGIPVDLYELADERDDDPRAAARRAIEGLTRLRPTPIAAAGQIRAITPATYDLDLERLGAADVVVEAVTERYDVKQALYRRVGPALGSRTIMASNTSGLHIGTLARALPEAVRARFCGVHFFNPPRYMHLVELIAHPLTDSAVLHRLEGFLTTGLGKGVLYARDTPGFIGNRVGLFALATVIRHAERLGIPFDLVDRLTGPGLGRPKSATFRTIDVVGLDVLAHVLSHLHESLDDDPWREVFRPPAWLHDLLERGALGQKRGAGLYRKGEQGIEVFEPETGDYRRVRSQLDERVRDALIEPDPVRKAEMLRGIDHPQAELAYASHRDLFHYCAYHLATLAPSAREVDLAFRWGYGWTRGPFELWQLMGWSDVANRIQAAVDAGEALADAPLPAWARESRREGVHGPRGSWSAEVGAPLPRSSHAVYRRQLLPARLVGEPKPTAATLWQSETVRMWDAGDDIAVVSLRRRPPIADAEVLDGLLGALDVAEREMRAAVLWQEAPPFCTGADLDAIRRAQEAGAYGDIEALVGRFQEATSELRYAPLPVVGAPEGRALGGGLELLLHCDARVVAFETYAGLVEPAVGLIPAGGGCRALARRAWELSPDGDPLPWLLRYFDEVLSARVTGSGAEGPWFRFGDRIVLHPSELLYAAKSEALALSDAGYRRPLPGARFPVAGTRGIEAMTERLNARHDAGELSDHDRLIGDRLARALCGGPVEPGTELDDGAVLEDEGEAFLELARQPATAARVAHMLDKGQRLRN